MKKCLIIAVIFLLPTLCAFATEEPQIELDKIAITPYGYEEILNKTASSVTTITPGEILNSNARKVLDIFRTIPGVTVRDWYGNGAQAAVDMAGFGEQAALNVLVLVNGMRVNNVDLSGVDWSQIPLDQVERIEVIRGGGAGSVLYGDNASGGVINIITKKGSGKPKVDLQTTYGSYDMNAQKLSVGGGHGDKLSYWFNAGRDATNGYRNNSFNKNTDFASKLEYNFGKALSTHFNSGFHASTFGMPASLNQSVINQFSRTYARYGKDHANNKDFYFVLGPKIESSYLGNLNIDFTYRQKNTDTYFLTSGLYTQRNTIETFGILPKYTLDHALFEHDNKLISGLDYYRVYFDSNKYAIPDDAIQNLTSINKTSIGGYLQDEFSIFKQLTAVCGYRYELTQYAFTYHDNSGWNPDIDNKLRPQQRAFNTGLVYTYQNDSNVFFNIGKSFRFPQVDEFTFNDALFQQQLNTNLQPQSSINYQVGIRHNFSDRLSSSFSLFRMNVKNEIYYNSTGGALGFGENENYNKTVHEGIESSINEKLNDKVALFANYTFTNAYFDGGQYNENEIPLVPKNKGSIGIRLSLPNDLKFNITGTYLGNRYFLNDQANAYSKLNGYMLADTNLSWRHNDLTVTFGINNLFNRIYSEYAGVTVANGIKFYYPSPERNYTLKVDYAF